MDTILRGWTSEKVMLLAGNTHKVIAARALAMPRKWDGLGHNRLAIWGLLPQRGGDPIETVVDLLKLRAGKEGGNCTCGEQQPCEHALALLFLLLESPETLREGTPPPFVSKRLDAAAQRAHQRFERSKTRDAVPDAAVHTNRYRQIADGLEELDAWLVNLIRHGLGDPRVTQYAFWDTIADRMTDAQAPRLAQALRDAGSLANQGSESLEPLLDALGRMYLLVESFKRFEAQSLEAQADIRTALGWSVKPNEIYPADDIHDEWLVVGKRHIEVNQWTHEQRLWLLGNESNRYALLEEIAPQGIPFEHDFSAGDMIDGALVFQPSRYPLRAFVQGDPAPRMGRALRGDSILAHIQEYGFAQAQNPWLNVFPMLLDSAVPTRFSGSWVVREASGTYLPLSNRFQPRWSLLALSGGHPIQIAGEWDGGALFPLCAIADGRFVDLSEGGLT